MSSSFTTAVSQHIWETRYRYADGGCAEASIDATWERVARALARVEPREIGRAHV